MAQIVQANQVSNLDSYLTALGYVSNNSSKIIPLALDEQTIANSIPSLSLNKTTLAPINPINNAPQGYLVTYSRGNKRIQVIFNQDPTQVANSDNTAINIRGAVLIQLSSGEILID